MSEDLVRKLAEDVGGTIETVGRLPDGSGFAVMSMPLPANHWSRVEPDRFNVPAMPFRMGEAEYVTIAVFPNAGYPDRTVRLSRHEFAQKIREAGKYAYRCATLNGKEPDPDPDALLQNLVVGLLGYWTADGLSGDAFANPEGQSTQD